MLKDFRADLHSHSHCSDGTCSPEDLLKLAKQKGLQGLSITDHDTLQAYSHLDALAKKWGIHLLPGVEFSTFYKQESVHVLAYGFSPDDPHLIALCKRHKKRRIQRVSAMLKRLQQLGIQVDEQQLYALTGKDIASIGRPHLAQLLMEKQVVSSVKEAFQKYLGFGKKAFVQGEQISCHETLEIIKKSGGKAFLAHPHLLQRRFLFQELMRLPFDGLEGYYANLPPSREKPFLDYAKAHGLLISGGSDFHGSCKPEIELGASFVGEQDFQALYKEAMWTI